MTSPVAVTATGRSPFTGTGAGRATAAAAGTVLAAGVIVVGVAGDAIVAVAGVGVVGVVALFVVVVVAVVGVVAVGVAFFVDVGMRRFNATMLITKVKTNKYIHHHGENSKKMQRNFQKWFVPIDTCCFLLEHFSSISEHNPFRVHTATNSCRCCSGR